MTFTDAIRTCWGKYAVISGRASRSEYWWWALFTLLVSLGFSVLEDGLLGGVTYDLLGSIASLVLLLPSLCAGGRRLHDRDMSAWWLLLILIPAVGWIVLLCLMVLKGTPGDNRFGPPPAMEGAASGPSFGQ
ncbi:DUF805 domain-containing protein [Pseudooceanicola sp. CBS1P-1]|uniref:DUF805 domain-containing protein n=1 Tax=Pseudooceanicola albus TaxID=2692189 RepID=A0A6L7G652_9RHOB|nr:MULTISPECIES: DUF805 domain-containing protein [Pseudooceanicola]MBT9384863.1 DUF805 domain-containing protein [Pseudooceanicola endophyticus]MXN18143.1 DUF805 domain-containing protein [Pseudooceanicola albus]